MLLSELKTGQSAVILRVLGHGGFRKRIMEMGFIRGKKVKVLLNAPLKDPIKYQVMDYEVSLRRSEAAMVEVITEEEAATMIHEQAHGDAVEHPSVDNVIRSSQKTINIALVGNPNSGKTSLFNAASGAHEHVGNYGGVTVDVKQGKFRHKGYTFNIYDLPGTYSLSAYSPEEIFVRRHLVEQAPDVVVNVVAASNLERNLYLTTELIDMDCTAVMALNMYDELEQSGAKLDYEALGSMLGIPIVPTVSRSEKGIDKLFDTIIDVYENRDPRMRHIHIPHVQELEDGVDALRNAIKADGGVAKHFPPRYLAIKMLERDTEVEKLLSGEPAYAKWAELRDREVERIERVMGEDIETIVTDDKYGFIAGGLKETYTPGSKEQVRTTEIIDSFVTNKLFGFPIFILLMWLMFECTFSLGQYPMDWIESGVGALGDWLQRVMSDGMLKDMLIDGVIGGVGGVIVFLPNILILFFFISLMEDTGYMARAAFIMDRGMHKIGLHGKSFIPLLMGFGCNVPAIMATRTLESRKDRILTMLVVPFMSCSARLPVYTLLISAFFPKNQGLMLLSIYAIGILIGILSSVLMKNLFFKKEEAPFVMELPPYRIPTGKSVIRHMWGKGVQYLKKMGSVILIASVIVWALMTYPKNVDYSQDYDTTRETIAQSDLPEEIKEETTREIDREQAGEHQEKSYIGQLGHFIEPAIRPLGFDWRIGVSLISGFAAKEIVVSTMAVLANSDEEEEGSFTDNLQKLTYTSGPKKGERVFTPLVAYTMMIFILLYFPCVAAIVAIRKEAGWRWALFSVLYTTGLAWILSFIVYQIGLLVV